MELLGKAGIFQVMGQVSDLQIGLVGGYTLNMILKADGDAATAPGLSAQTKAEGGKGSLGQRKGIFQAMAELLPMPSLMLEGFGAENQTLLASLVPASAEAGTGSWGVPSTHDHWGSDSLQPSHLHGILPKVIFGIECLIAEVSSGTRRAVCGLSPLLLSLSSPLSAFTSLQDELGDKGLTAHPPQCCSHSLAADADGFLEER